MYCLRLLISLLVLLAASGAALAQISIPGKVVDVLDGRTLLVDIQSGHVQVELQYIEVPTGSGGMSDIVKNHLKELTVGRSVQYIPRQIMHDSTVGQVMAGGVDVSQQMLRDGAAWLEPAAATGQDAAGYNAYKSTETIARNEKRGIWAEASLHPSWENRPVGNKNFPSGGVGVIERDEPSDPAPTSTSSSTSAKRSAPNRNPFLGDVGALYNAYDPSTRHGVVGIGLGMVEMSPEQTAAGEKMALSLTYYYEQDPSGSRKGSVVLMVIAETPKPRSTTENILSIVTGDKVTPVGKPQKTSLETGETYKETLYYPITKEQLRKMTFGDTSYLKLGTHDMIYIGSGHYSFSSLLQVVD